MAMETSFDNRRVRYETLHNIGPDDFGALFEAAEIRNGYSMLDCGCGYGAVTREILTRKPKGFSISIDLVDNSPVQLSDAKEELKEFAKDPSVKLAFHMSSFPAILAEQEKIGVQWRGRFDLVVAKMVLHENTRDEQEPFLRALFDSLKPGGILLLWEVVLTDSNYDFVSDVIKKKDELCHFDSLATRRHLLKGLDIASLLESGGFVHIELYHYIDYVEDTKRRLIAEFGNDQALWEQWNGYIRNRFEALEDDVKEAFKFLDKQSTISFRIGKGIFRAFRPANSLHVLSPFESTAIKFPEQAEKIVDIYPNVVSSSICKMKLNELFAGEKTLLRASAFTRALGVKQFCKGTDYLFNDPVGSDVFRKVYLAYIIWVYCANLSPQWPTHKKSMAHSLSNIFRATASTAWLKVQWVPSDTAEGILQLGIGSCESFEGKVLVKVPSIAQRFFAEIGKIIDSEVQFVNEQIRCVSQERFAAAPIVRLLANNNISLDEVGKNFAEMPSVRSLWEESICEIIDSSWSIDEKLHSPYWDDFKEWIEVLIPLQELLRLSGTPNAYYILTPSLLNATERLEDGVCSVCTAKPLSGLSFQDLMYSVAGLWGGLGALEATMGGSHEKGIQEQANRSLTAAGFSHQATHIFGERMKSGFSLLRFLGENTGEDSDITLQQLWAFASDKWQSTYPPGVELAARIAQIKYANLVPDIVKDVLKPPVDRNIFDPQLKLTPAQLVDEVWTNMVKPLMETKSTREGYKFSGHSIQLQMAGEFPHNILIPGSGRHLIEAIFFEMLWNAFRHGKWREGEPACPILRGQQLGGIRNPDVYIFEVTNPCEVDASCKSTRGLQYIEQFASTLRSMKGSRDISLHVSRPTTESYRITLTLPWDAEGIV